MILGLIAGVASTGLPFQASSAQDKKPMSPSKFPPGSVECKAGDYLIAQRPDQQWIVYKVEDLVRFSRLMPLAAAGGVMLMEETHLLDSKSPAYADDVFLLLQVHEQRFASPAAAAAAVRGGALGAVMGGYYANVKAFPSDRTQVVSAGGR